MTKYLVTGAAGLFGINFCLNTCQKQPVVGLTRRFIKGLPFDTDQADLLDKGALEKMVEKHLPDVLIHAAADANLESCEREPRNAFQMNAELPGRIAEITAQRGIQLIHMSTDAVFAGDGDKPLSEEDPTNPKSVYAQSKLEGEHYVLQTDPYAIVARVNFFGWSISGTRSLSEFFFNRLSTNTPCFGFTDVYFCPMYVEDLTETFHRMVDKRLRGLYHVVGSEALSKYSFGQELGRVFGLDIHNLSPQSVENSTLTAPRSHNLRLDTNKLSTALGSSIPAYQQGLERLYSQFKNSYPQKLRSYQQN